MGEKRQSRVWLAVVTHDLHKPFALRVVEASRRTGVAIACDRVAEDDEVIDYVITMTGTLNATRAAIAHLRGVEQGGHRF